MELELDQDITSMRVCCFHCHVQYRGDLLGSLALGHELHDLALPRRQSGCPGCCWAHSLPLKVTVHNHIRHTRAETGAIPLQSFHCCDQVVGSVELKNPPANSCVQTVPHHLLGVHVGK